MEIIRIPTSYALQIKHLSEKDIAYVMKSIFLLSTWEMIEIEDNLRWWLVQSIWREIIQLENKARAKKWEEWLSYQLATQDATSSTKTCDQTKSNQTNSSQIKSNQTNPLVALQPNEYSQTMDYLRWYEIETEIPDYAENYREEWIKFCMYWSEKWKTGKIRAEWEKTFELKKRFATWMSRKKETYQNNSKTNIPRVW